MTKMSSKGLNPLGANRKDIYIHFNLKYNDILLGYNEG